MNTKQRDDFSDYLRAKCRVTRATSHKVARQPHFHWLMVEIPGGWFRAYYLSADPEKRRRQKNTILYTLRTNPSLFPISHFIIRWKVDPQPGPNAWELRRWDNYKKRYVNV